MARITIVVGSCQHPKQIIAALEALAPEKLRAEVNTPLLQGLLPYCKQSGVVCEFVLPWLLFEGEAADELLMFYLPAPRIVAEARTRGLQLIEAV